MTIGEHLEELRRRVLVGLVVVVAAFVVCWIFRDRLLRAALHPHFVAMARLGREGAASRPVVLTYLEGFFVYAKVCLLGALVFGGPVLLAQLWGFVASGLYPHERRVVRRYFPFSLVLFATGVAFGYVVLIPTAIVFLAGPGAVPEWTAFQPRLDPVLNLFLLLALGLGIVFQLPLVMLVLSRIGIFTPAAYRSKRRWFVLVAVIAAAFLTPGPDPVSQVLLALPMLFLYEFGILLAGVAYRSRRPPGDAATA